MSKNTRRRVVLRVFGKKDYLVDFIDLLEILARDLSNKWSVKVAHQAYWKEKELEEGLLEVTGENVGEATCDQIEAALGDGWYSQFPPSEDERTDFCVPSHGGRFKNPCLHWASVNMFPESAVQIGGKTP